MRRKEKQKQQRILHQTGFSPTSRPRVPGSPRTQHLWSLNWEKVSGSTLALWVRLQRLQFPFIFLGGKLIANSNSGVMLMLFVLSWKTWSIVQPGAWLAKPPPGAQQFQDYLISGAAQSCVHSRQSLAVTVRAVSWQVRSKVRSLFDFVSEA